MNKLFLVTILSFLALATVFVAVSKPAYAEFDPFGKACSGVSDSSVCTESSQSQSTTNNAIYGKNGILTKVINLVSIVIGVVAVVVIIIAGLRFVISGGDATKVATAKSTILYAIVGLVVAATAQAMIAFVLNKL